MREALFFRTSDVQELVNKVRAHEPSATLLLESQVADRMATILSPDHPEDAYALENVAREIVAVLARDDHGRSPVDPIWDALDEIGPSTPAHMDEAAGRRVGMAVEAWRSELPARERKQLAREMQEAFAALRERDPAAHARLAKLLSGEFPGTKHHVSGGRNVQRPAYGRKVVLSSTLPPGDRDRPITRDEARELIRWREILLSLLPRSCHPSRRVNVPGGVSCIDFEGPRLSWSYIAGTAGERERTAFEAHLLSCDGCFEFHYRCRWALELLREHYERIVGQPLPSVPSPVAAEPARGGWRGLLTRLGLRN